MWVAEGTLSPEGAIDLTLKLYDLPGFEMGQAYLEGMLFDTEVDIMEQETYKSIQVHLEPFESYKAVQLGIGATLELFVFRSGLIPVSAMVPDEPATGLRFDPSGNIFHWERFADIAEIHLEEWTGISSPW